MQGKTRRGVSWSLTCCHPLNFCCCMTWALLTSHWHCLCWASLRPQGNLILPHTRYTDQVKLMLGEIGPPQDHLAKPPPPVTQSSGCIVPLIGGFRQESSGVEVMDPWPAEPLGSLLLCAQKVPSRAGKEAGPRRARGAVTSQSRWLAAPGSGELLAQPLG